MCVGLSSNLHLKLSDGDIEFSLFLHGFADNIVRRNKILINVRHEEVEFQFESLKS